MNKSYLRLIQLVLCGILILAGCPADNVTNVTNAEQDDPNYSETEAFFPVVDALSSASILRVNSKTMVYVGERTGTNYWLNKVDVDDPGKKISRNIGGNAAVITAGGGKIGLIQAVEHGYEAFAGSYTKIYDAQSLVLLKTLPLAPPAAEGRIVEPLHHRDPSLAITDTYAVVLTEDDGFFASGGAQQYVSVYDIAGSKGASHTNAFSGDAGGPRGAANTDLGVGTLMGAVVNGDYIILGGNAGTAVFKINAGGANLAISKVTEGYSTDTTANHWFKDNGAYVLESKSNTGTVKVWKWNGDTAPTAVGTVDVNGSSTGSVQALCFDPEDEAKAYFYSKAGANNGKVLTADLSNPTAVTELFTFSHWVISVTPRGQPTTWYDCPLTSLWTIEKQKTGNDDYFVFSGSYSYTPADSSAVTVGAVFTVKNPESNDSFGGTFDGTTNSNSVADATGKVSVETFSAPYGTAVRTLKTFKSGSGDIYFAAKNYTANAAASNYKLVLEQIN
jgi:WD40 repeat protein